MTIFQRLFHHSAKKANIMTDVITPAAEPIELPTLQHTLNEFSDCMDLSHRNFPELLVDILYFPELMDKKEFTRDVIEPFSNIQSNEVDNLLKQSQFKETIDTKDFIDGILDGKAGIFHQNRAYLIYSYGPESRTVQPSEAESVITGPHDAFVESLNTNLSLIRRRVKSSHLKAIKLTVGEVTKSDVLVLYIKDIANMDFVNEMVRRIKLVEMDAVHDGNMLTQYIDDCPNSIFPQLLTTERPDAAASKLVAGRVAAILDGSPSVICAPTSFFEFFSSPDDYYQRWALGTATRVLRFVAFFITVTFTAVYVSVTTYHYEMIPETLIITMAESRSRVPFPPLYEALLMEVTIELLREAGARLPTKIGQTIGIVGGIVIGQAAVQAGLTSNILIIAVASSSIASFVIPSYVMNSSIRLLRFGLILLAGLWGNFGLMLGVTITIVHLSGLTSLGASYLMPVAPMAFNDWKDVFIRAPFWSIKDRPMQSNAVNKIKNKMRK